jgi:DNA repair protein RadC
MKHGDALNSPGAVRDYLRLLLHNREHKVFVVVLLDA